MTPQLKAAFTDAERSAAAAIGTGGQANARQKVEELFRTLSDPLLSVDEVRELLVDPGPVEIQLAIGTLEAAGVLESTTDTQRPLDDGVIELFRLKDVPVKRLTVTALEARLPGSKTALFQWTADGRSIRSIARVSRLDAISEEGVQREEIRGHIDSIARGIEGGAEIPNSVLLVLLDESTIYEGEDGDANGEASAIESQIRIRALSEFVTSSIPGSEGDELQQVRVVQVDFPYRRAAFDDEKPALLVDGQQRTAALSKVSVEDVPHFAMPVNAVIANEDEAKEIFALANQTVKIATDFKRALFATMSETPAYLRSEKVPAEIARDLALKDKDSPFYQIVKHPGVRRDAKQVVAYNTLFLIVKQFMDGDLASAAEDPAVLQALVKRAFAVVKTTWPEAWGKKPVDSRLMHGAGLRAVAGLLVKRLDILDEEEQDLSSDQAWQQLRKQLGKLRPRVPWTDEAALAAPEVVRRNYNNLIKDAQNTGQDIAKLEAFLHRELKKAIKGVKEDS